MKTKRVRNAIITSVWDGGTAVNARCRVNLHKRNIVNIGKNDYLGDDGQLDICECEYVVLDGDEKKYKVVQAEEYAKMDKNESKDVFYYN